MKSIEERAEELYPYCDGILSNDDIKYNVEMKAQRDNFIKIATEFREVGREEERSELVDKIKEYFFNTMDKDAYKNVSEQFYKDTVKFIFSLENVVKSEEQSSQKE